MKLTEFHSQSKDRLLRSSDVLVNELPEPEVEFDARRDLTAEQQQALFSRLRENRESQDWRYYLELYAKLATFWPEMPGEPPITTLPLEQLAEVVKELFEREPGQMDIRLRVAADLRVVGLPSDRVFDPRAAIPEFLEVFDNRCRVARIDMDFSKDAIDIARLGLRSVDQLFVDRENAWQALERELQSLLFDGKVHVDDDHLEMVAWAAGMMRVLFPERAIPFSKTELQIMKKDLAQKDPKVTGAVITYAMGLSFLTAVQVHLGRRGEYVIQKSASQLNKRSQLPERPSY